MLKAYRDHVAERAALGIPPLPLDAKQVAELIELIKNPPAGEDAFLLDLLTHRVPPGVDDAAKVKASFLADDSISAYMKQRSGGVPYIANMQLSREDAIELLASGKADAVAFGRAYIANPDLYERLLQDAPLNELKLENMIGTGVAEGYVDYPTLAEMETAAV